VFGLSPTTDGQWKLKVLHSFNPNNEDGDNPNGLVLDAVGAYSSWYTVRTVVVREHSV
jgi:hypothetical protein